MTEQTEQPRSFFTKVAGVSRRNADGGERQEIIKRCRVGDKLDLIREPDNPHDAYAVKVCRQTGEQIGYIPAHLAREISEAFEKGARIDAEISDLTGGGLLVKRTRGVNIRLTRYRTRSL